MGFILEAIKGSYAEQSEDRLTQVFCACFNNSNRFRRLFWRFIRCNGSAGLVRARTQQQYAIRGAYCRADILIGIPGCPPSIVVENKIDSPLTPRQLKTYNRVGDFLHARKIAIVKHYFEMVRVSGWTILHWADFYSTLMLSRPVKNKADSFALNQFSELLEDLGMARALVIEKERLQELGQFMKTVREPKPNHHLGSVTPFETATDYLRMLEDIVSMMGEEQFFRNKLGKKARFSPWLSWWFEGDGGKKLHPWLGVDIRLRKANKKGIARISAGILFDSKRGSLTIQTYTADKSGTFLEWEVHKGDLHFKTYARKVIAFWKKQLK